MLFSRPSPQPNSTKRRSTVPIRRDFGDDTILIGQRIYLISASLQPPLTDAGLPQLVDMALRRYGRYGGHIAICAKEFLMQPSDRCQHASFPMVNVAWTPLVAAFPDGHTTYRRLQPHTKSGHSLLPSPCL